MATISTVEEAREVLAAKMKPGVVDIDAGQTTGTPGVWVFAVTTFDHSRGKPMSFS